MLNEFFIHKNLKWGFWQHLVSHSQSYTRCFAPYFWRSHYQPQSWCRLATSDKLRFHTVLVVCCFLRLHYQPPRSCNLKPLDYYLWGAAKDKCYVDKPETIDALKDNIREAIGEIQLHMIDNVLKIWNDRVGYCMASRGSHLCEIIFYY